MTYVPTAGGLRGSSLRGRGSVRSPKVAVLAGALLAGGSAHSIAGADGLRPVTLLPEASTKPVEPIEPAALPLLALASIEAPPVPHAAVAPVLVAKAGAALSAPKRPPPRPVAAPRRDLAGFLADQGHVVAPLPEETPPAAELTDTPADPLGTDLAAAPATAAPVAAAAAETGVPVPPPAIAQSFPSLSVDGTELGAVTMRGDTVHLAALLGLLQLRMPAEEFERLRAAPAADSFVSLATLREAGLSVTVDPAGERLTLAAL